MPTYRSPLFGSTARPLEPLDRFRIANVEHVAGTIDRDPERLDRSFDAMLRGECPVFVELEELVFAVEEFIDADVQFAVGPHGDAGDRFEQALRRRRPIQNPVVGPAGDQVAGRVVLAYNVAATGVVDYVDVAVRGSAGGIDRDELWLLDRAEAVIVGVVFSRRVRCGEARLEGDHVSRGGAGFLDIEVGSIGSAIAAPVELLRAEEVDRSRVGRDSAATADRDRTAVGAA
jgi:hypothetical protein